MFKLMIALLVASASAFAPIASRAAVARAPGATMQMTDFSWRRTYNGKAPGSFVAPAAPAAAAAAPTMSVEQACIFMADVPSATFEEKKAFLLSKGVSEFVITEAACTASDTTLVL